MKYRRRFSALAVFAFALAFLTGCAGPRTMLMQQVRTDLAASDYPKAFQTYKAKVKETQDVEELLNLGLLAFEAGDYPAAQKALDDAGRLAEERETKSLSRETAGIAISDRVRAYQGTDMDKALIHYYRALAFLQQGDPSAAVVEGRAIASYLEVLSRDGKHTFRDDAYLQWFSGTLYESFGQTNDAWISFKRSRDLYRNNPYGVPEPSFLCPVLYEAEQAVGVPESESSADSGCQDDVRKLNPDDGRVVVICEAGLAPQILESNLVLPIFKSDNTSFANDADRERYADELYRRDRTNYDQKKLKYLLRVAIPYYPDHYSGSRVRSVVIHGDSTVVQSADPTEDIGAMLVQDLKDRYPAIIIRAIVRGLIKYAATEMTEKAVGKSGGWGDILSTAVNLAGVATEAADTRSWETLPDKIYVANFQLPPGRHSLRADFSDGSGTVLQRHNFPEVDVKRGEVVILRVRSTQ